MHWTMMVVYVEEKKICYLDSMGASGKKYTDAILKYFQDESRAKLNVDLDVSLWHVEYYGNGTGIMENIPQQHNGVDCGVFSIMFADFISDNLPLVFTQNEMDEYRRKICASILRGSLN